MLEQVADVRNLLAHGKTEAYEYPVVPTRRLAQQLHGCVDALLHPERVADRFLREVRTVSRNDSLAGVLALVNEYKYSQFPVYDDGRCQGLLTENGITRWLAASTGSVPLGYATDAVRKRLSLFDSTPHLLRFKGSASKGLVAGDRLRFLVTSVELADPDETLLREIEREWHEELHRK